jgi:hypothetical protein
LVYFSHFGTFWTKKNLATIPVILKFYNVVVFLIQRMAGEVEEEEKSEAAAAGNGGNGEPEQDDQQVDCRRYI